MRASVSVSQAGRPPAGGEPAVDAAGLIGRVGAIPVAARSGDGRIAGPETTRAIEGVTAD